MLHHLDFVVALTNIDSRVILIGKKVVVLIENKYFLIDGMRQKELLEEALTGRRA